MFGNIISAFKTSIAKLIFRNKIDYSTWIFSSSYNTKFNYNSKYFFEYVLNNEPSIKPIYVINEDEIRIELQKKYGDEYFIETKSMKGIKKVLSAGVWFTSAGLPIYGLNLNKERIIINLWHGVPLKRIALMDNNISKLTKLYFKCAFSNNYTYIVTTSKNLVPIMKESFGVLEEKIVVWGQPRNDAMFRKNDRNKILNSLYLDLPKYEKIILYAPTYREDASTIFFPFEDFDKEELNSFLAKNQLIIFIRCHQSETQNVYSEFGDRIQLINSDKIDEIMDIINIFDLLITDYSSIYIDFLLTKRPILFLPYDKEKYTSLRGFNFNYDTVTPGPKPNSFKEFKTELIKLLEYSTYYNENRQTINSFFNSIQQECSPEIVDLINKKINMLNRTVPFLE